MKLKPLTALQVIDLVPDSILDALSQESGVDFGVKKLQGKVLFKLIIYSFLSSKQVSLRILEAIYNSEKFKALFNIPFTAVTRKATYAAFSFRLKNIDYRYFEKIFNYLITSTSVQDVFFNSQKINLRKIDSTMLSLSSKLLSFGTHTSGGQNNLKVTLELTGGIPVNFILFKDQRYLAEELALPEAVKRQTIKKALNIAIFDRGIKKVSSYLDFSEQKISFISRLQNHKNFKVVKVNSLGVNHTATLELISDKVISFTGKPTLGVTAKSQKFNRFRVVTAKSKATGQVIRFISNINFLTATEITELYKSRWEIETFFKFIKQELNFKHFLSRDENGIKAMVFLTMITAILLTLYKKVNNLSGWAVVKIKFMDELEVWLMKTWHQEMAPAFLPFSSSPYPSLSG
ncbi:MAG: IS4 family transposase [Candidatus Doudnabacteria bacterium]|nr:IS4 family transposase [Candidatus Doudnabacteria bacterium]